MRFLIVVLLFGLVAVVANAQTSRWASLFAASTRTRNGGADCISCTALFLLLDQITEFNNFTHPEALPYFCSILPGIYKRACDGLQEQYNITISEQLDTGDNADVICHNLGFCFSDPGQPYCHLLPEPQGGLKKAIETAKQRSNVEGDVRLPEAVCALPPMVELCEYLASLNEGRYPVFDDDKDGFSTVDRLQGYDWRGYDCDDENSEVYPGRIPIDEDRDFDSNCNGIWGVNPTSGVAYETELCGNSEARGLLYFGDSVGAHFHFPVEWLEVAKFTPNIFDNLTYVLENDIDWPQQSFGTGHVNLTWDIVMGNVPTNSLFWRMRNRNLCNDNDYHNQAYNGGETNDILELLNFTRSRNQVLDKPVFAIFAQFGNDVCNGKNDTFGNMTDPEVYRANVLAFFDEMERNLPKGSHLLTVGLLMGQYLYPSLVDYYHPIGQLNSDITYKLVYAYLDCLLLSPCRGWMFPDEADRNVTTERANVLSAILEELSITYANSYENFDIKYIRMPIDELYESYGENFHYLLEPIDGFHPNKAAQDIFAAYIWNHLIQHYPDFVGPENINNALIHSLFGL